MAVTHSESYNIKLSSCQSVELSALGHVGAGAGNGHRQVLG